MSITLVRHGKPNIDLNRWLTPRGFGVWITKYDQANVGQEAPHQSYPWLEKDVYVVCSDLPRANCSATLLGLNIDEDSSLFREVAMPSLNTNWPKLPLKMWLLIFRVAWLFGYSNNIENIKCAKARAIQAADYLMGLEREYGDLVLVGHGLFNRFIAKRLRRFDYKVVSVAGLSDAYWSITTLAST